MAWFKVIKIKKQQGIVQQLKKLSFDIGPLVCIGLASAKASFLLKLQMLP